MMNFPLLKLSISISEFTEPNTLQPPDLRFTIYDLRFTIYDLRFRFTTYDLRFTIHVSRFTFDDSRLTFDVSRFTITPPIHIFDNAFRQFFSISNFIQ